jgi:triacylglycerol lipase
MLGISAPTQGAVALARALQRRLGRAERPGCLTETCGCEFARDFSRPFPEKRVRLTSIYSKGDGVVRWEGCLVPYADCIEVTGSHVGLIFNRKVYRAVGQALAVPELGP